MQQHLELGAPLETLRVPLIDAITRPCTDSGNGNAFAGSGNAGNGKGK